jgi:hypothetical protein
MTLNVDMENANLLLLVGPGRKLKSRQYFSYDICQEELLLCGTSFVLSV